MLGIARRLTFAFMLLTLFTLLFSCEKPEIVKEGIDVIDGGEKEYSEKSIALAEESIFEVLNSISDADEQTLLLDSELLAKSSRGVYIPEEDYVSFFETVRERSNLIASVFSGKYEGEELMLLYSDLCGCASSDFVGNLAFCIARYAYSTRYREQMALYESKGENKDRYQYILVAAEGVLEKQRVLTEEIGVGNFVSVMELGFFLRGLLVSDAFAEGRLSGFNNEELRILFSKVDFSDIRMSKAGYLQSFEYMGIILSAEDGSGYCSELVKSMIYNGDGEELAEIMDEIILLTSTVKSGLTAEDVGYVREKEYRKLCASVFERFSGREYEILGKISTINYNNDSYDRIGAEYYGDAYEEYRKNGVSADLDELRASVGTDDFYTKLEGFVFGMSPAFSFGMKND